MCVTITIEMCQQNIHSVYIMYMCDIEKDLQIKSLRGNTLHEPKLSSPDNHGLKVLQMTLSIFLPQ